MLPAPTLRPPACAAGCPPLAACSPVGCAHAHVAPFLSSRTASHSRAPRQLPHAVAELSLAEPVIDEAPGLAVTPRGDEDFCGDAGALMLDHCVAAQLTGSLSWSQTTELVAVMLILAWSCRRCHQQAGRQRGRGGAQRQAVPHTHDGVRPGDHLRPSSPSLLLHVAQPTPVEVRRPDVSPDQTRGGRPVHSAAMQWRADLQAGAR